MQIIINFGGLADFNKTDFNKTATCYISKSFLMLKKESTASLLCCDFPDKSTLALRLIAFVVHTYTSGKSHDSTAKHPNLPFHQIKILSNVPLNVVLGISSPFQLRQRVLLAPGRVPIHFMTPYCSVSQYCTADPTTKLCGLLITSLALVGT